MHPDNPTFDRALEAATACLRDGRLDEAEAGFRALLRAEPGHAEVNHLLGTLVLQGKQAQSALPLLRAALESNPKNSLYWLSYIDALIQAGQHDAARAMLEQGRQRGLRGESVENLMKQLDAESASATGSSEIGALAALFSQSRFAEMEQAARRLTVQFPDLGAGWKALGTAIVMQGRAVEALSPLEQAVALLPGDAEAHISLGNVLHELGRFPDAEKSYRLAIGIDPRNAEAHRHLGMSLCDQGQLVFAEASCRHALELKPDAAEASSNLARVLYAQGRLGEAEQYYRQALQMRPALAEAHYDLATLFNEQFRFDAAEAGFRRALQLNPEYIPALNNLGIALNGMGRHADAETVLRRALELSPRLSDALCNLSASLDGQGRHAEADGCLAEAITANPSELKARGKRLFNLNYASRHGAAYRLAQAREYGEVLHRSVGTPYSSWLTSAMPTRLRVGVVSGDLCNHPVGYFLESLLAHADSSRLEFFAYPTAHKNDGLTARIRPAFAAWHSIAGVNDEIAARQIHADGVHLLLDLSGHTAGNRLPVFARKPAPIQASWLGYFATTGVREMDYLIADPVGVGEMQIEQFTEAICYLPETRICFTPPPASPPVAPLPCIRRGYVTFGCFQNLSKVGDDVLSLWARILALLPDARLRMQCRELGYAASRELLMKRLRAHGVDDARVSLHGRVDRNAYLVAHSEVDVILDTFPYPGGTTTCEALWMGVPTLTLAGDSMLSRQGASLLTAGGLPDWIATDEASYIAQAVAFANDHHALSVLRANLRDRVRASPLFDAPRFARNFEDAVWWMWRQSGKT